MEQRFKSIENKLGLDDLVRNMYSLATTGKDEEFKRVSEQEFQPYLRQHYRTINTVAQVYYAAIRAHLFCVVSPQNTEAKRKEHLSKVQQLMRILDIDYT